VFQNLFHRKYLDFDIRIRIFKFARTIIYIILTFLFPKKSAALFGKIIKQFSKMMIIMFIWVFHKNLHNAIYGSIYCKMNLITGGYYRHWIPWLLISQSILKCNNSGVKILIQIHLLSHCHNGHIVQIICSQKFINLWTHI